MVTAVEARRKTASPASLIASETTDMTDAAKVSLCLLELLCDLEELDAELRTAEEASFAGNWTFQDSLSDRLHRVGMSEQKVEAFRTWRRSLSALFFNPSNEDIRLAKIAAVETAGLDMLSELVAWLKKRNQQTRETAALGNAIAA
jgi:hypothetical protein